MSTSHDGGCWCGAVRYRIHRPVGRPCICHCRSCQRASGGVAVGWCFVALDDFEVLEGRVAEATGPSGARRGFCAACGTSLTYSPPGAPTGRLDVTLASLDAPQRLPPTDHIQVADRHPGVEFDGTLPSHAEWRPEDP